MRRFILTSVTAVLLAGPAFAETIHIGVNGLICAFCAAGIENNFKNEKAVQSVKVDLDNKLVTLETGKPDEVSDATIRQVITDSGFTVTSIHRQK